jgi:hypothetical protein
MRKVWGMGRWGDGEMGGDKEDKEEITCSLLRVPS